MLNAKIIGDSKVVQDLRAITPRVRSALETKIQRLTIQLQRHVVADKLQGQVLKVRSGRLQRSINQAMTTSESDIIGIVSTSVKYAAVHEYGGVIHMPARMRKVYRATDKSGDFKHDGRFVKKSKSNFMTEHQGKAYDINMPERSFLRSALADQRDSIVQGINDAVKQGLKR